MKKRVVQTLSQGPNIFGQVSSPLDLMKAQDFLHDRLSSAVHDFINVERAAEITGFEYELGAGNAFDIEISRPGRIYTNNGISYDLLADLTLDFAPAHASLSRFDLVVASIEDEVDAELDLIPFVRLRTSEEFTAEAPPYPPQNISAPTEKHWRAVPEIKTGTPAETPAIPAAASNEIPLYLVKIAPGVTQLNDGDVFDLREVAWTLRKLNDLVGASRVDIASLITRVTRLEDLAGQPIDLSQIFGEIRTLGEILADLESRIAASNDLPEIRYERPKYPSTDPRSSQVLATGQFISGMPYLDIDIGARVNFGDAEFPIEPRRFVDPELNARYVTIAGAPASHERRSVDLTLGSVTPIGTSGAVDFLERAAVIAPARSRAACAARSSQYVEIYGGLSTDNSTPLGDWKTYDTNADTLTARTITGAALPNSNRPAMITYGDGNSVLVIAGDDNTTTPGCYRVNATTGVATAISGTKPTGHQFIGDLVVDNKIIIVAITKSAGDTYIEPTFWEYDTTTHLFTELGVTGSVPAPTIDYCGGCYLKENQLVFVTFDPITSASGKTFIFDRTTVAWTELNIPQPYLYSPEKQLPISGFRMAHVNGRPLLVGGDLTRTEAKDEVLAKVWELANVPSTQLSLRPYIGLAWSASNATFPRTQDPGFCSTLGTTNLPDSKAFLFGGYGFGKRQATNRVYSSVQSGLIAVTYNGVAGVSIGENAKSVQFELPMYTADWDVAAYLANFDGKFLPGNIGVEASFDDGAHWHQIAPGATFLVADSSNPGERRLRVTLYNNGANSPILTRLHEAFDEDGGDEIEERVVLRIDRLPGGNDAMYMDRLGNITMEQVPLKYSTPKKCLIMVTDYDPDTAPGSRSFVNQRRPIYKMTGTAGPGPENVACHLAVPVRNIEGVGIKIADNSLYRVTLADPGIDFLNEGTTIVGVTTGDAFEILFMG